MSWHSWNPILVEPQNGSMHARSLLRAVCERSRLRPVLSVLLDVFARRASSGGADLAMRLEEVDRRVLEAAP